MLTRMNFLHSALIRTVVDINISFINAKLLKAYVQVFFSEIVVNIWNSLHDVVDFDSFYKFKCGIKCVEC